jgi:hypothetical protein
MDKIMLYFVEDNGSTFHVSGYDKNEELKLDETYTMGTPEQEAFSKAFGERAKEEGVNIENVHLNTWRFRFKP